MDEIFKLHDEKDEERFGNIFRVLFGTPEDPNIGQQKVMGMEEKVNEMYSILTEASQEKKGVEKLFDRIKGGLNWLILIGIIIGLIKGWWLSILNIIVK